MADSAGRRAGRQPDLRRARSGAAALEFAIVAVPFLMFLLFLFEVSFDFYLQESLDYAVAEGAREVQTGAAQSAPDAATFKAKYMCPRMASLLDCAALSVNVQPITSDYYSQGLVGPPVTGGTLDPSQYGFCPGAAGQLMLVQAVYVSPSIVGLLVPGMSMSYGAGRYRVTTSSIGFVNEPFAGGGAAPC